MFCRIFLFSSNKNYCIREKNGIWEPIRICQLNSATNPTQFWWKWAGLAVLFSRQLINDLFHTYSIISLIKKKDPINIFAHAFTVWLEYFQKNSIIIMLQFVLCHVDNHYWTQVVLCNFLFNH